MKNKSIIAAMFLVALAILPQAINAQTIVHDKQKEKQWKSTENGPWDFAPDWYYYFLHNGYSGAEMYWKWKGFSSGWRIRFKESKSSTKRIMPVRITAEETQRQKVSKVEEERKQIYDLYKEELAREADRSVDHVYSIYKDEFARMQTSISDGLLYCMQKSKGDLKHAVDELSKANEMLCADIAYIHKTGVGYGLENAKRQQAYEEAKAKMSELVGRTARLCAVAATHY